MNSVVRHIQLAVVGILMVFSSVSAYAQTIDESFQSPPDSARPHTWWHWMNGNVSREGITKDLEAMKAVGLAGFQLFDVGLGIPRGSLVYNSDAWYEYLAFAITEAERLGLEMGIHNASGWSCTGGPWISPEYSMKALVWSETRVGANTGGPIQLKLPDMSKQQQSLNFYRDIAVLAFPTPKAESRGGKPYRIEAWKEKALVNRKARSADFIPDLRKAPSDAVITLNQVLILTDRMNAAGKLNWTASSVTNDILRSPHDLPTDAKGAYSPPSLIGFNPANQCRRRNVKASFSASIGAKTRNC
jgi:hypothetical protein